MNRKNKKQYKKTACILCSINCGIKVEIEKNTIMSIKGDKDNPSSQGYLCQKASGLNYYQNHLERLKHPLKKNSEGVQEKVLWETCINEVAEKLKNIRDTYGGHAIAYYGGGGQGNHMNQAYSSSLRSVLKSPYLYNALGQEKTGDFWVNGKLFGSQSCHIAEDIEHSDYLLLLGTNPWQSHGIPQARKLLKKISKDPLKKIIVVDPRCTKTAKLADTHLAIKPSTDAFLITAMLAIIIKEKLYDKTFLEKHATGFEEIVKSFEKIDIDDYINKTELDIDLVKKITREFSCAKRACVRVDLGLQQSLNSTLNSYLEKLLFLLTGNFGKKGSNNLHTQFAPIIGDSDGNNTSKVTNMEEIGNFFPPNILPAEIDTSHPERIRALIVDSGNPIMTAADTQAYTKAFKQLDLLVVIDVAHTETTRIADYVLPAHSQFEKWEATFFTMEFPENYFQLREPLFESQYDTLPEPEIYKKLLIAMGEFPRKFGFLKKVAEFHLKKPKFNLFPLFLMSYLRIFPRYKRQISLILYETLGKALPKGMQNVAILWGLAYKYASLYPRQVKKARTTSTKSNLGEQLFTEIINKPSGLCISEHNYQEVWDLVSYSDKKIRLHIPEMIIELNKLKAQLSQQKNHKFPFILSAGERRSYNANQIFRNPEWRKQDKEGSLRINAEDAKSLNLTTGDKCICQSATGQIKVTIVIDVSMHSGHVSLPHGYGFKYRSEANAKLKQNGPAINNLTSADHCDHLAKTPFHKNIPVKLVGAL
jgi:anaerobic selenocysteine-containing dehydrogenase